MLLLAGKLEEREMRLPMLEDLHGILSPSGSSEQDLEPGSSISSDLYGIVWYRIFFLFYLMLRQTCLSIRIARKS